MSCMYRVQSRFLGTLPTVRHNCAASEFVLYFKQYSRSRKYHIIHKAVKEKKANGKICHSLKYSSVLIESKCSFQPAIFCCRLYMCTVSWFMLLYSRLANVYTRNQEEAHSYPALDKNKGHIQEKSWVYRWWLLWWLQTHGANVLGCLAHDISWIRPQNWHRENGPGHWSYKTTLVPWEPPGASIRGTGVSCFIWREPLTSYH